MQITVKRRGYAIQDDAPVYAALGKATDTDVDTRSDVRDLSYAAQDDAAAMALVKAFLSSDLRGRGCWLEIR
jgi:hypothetical protein